MERLFVSAFAWFVTAGALALGAVVAIRLAHRYLTGW